MSTPDSPAPHIAAPHIAGPDIAGPDIAGPDIAAPPTDPATATLPAEITRDDVVRLCEQLRTLLREDGVSTVVYDLSALAVPGIVTVDVLVRLQLTARRLGGRIVVHGADGALRDLLDLTGLRDLVLPSREELVVEGRRQTEQREQPLSVEERVDSDDLTA